ncbi:MAG: addiction module protein [Planctomycetes bacterium]|nr:addiction module protein [Planctomycetota bacterium]
MTQVAQTILETLLRLSDADREELAVRLVESLDSDTDGNADAEWEEEVRARVEDVRSGRVRTVSWSAAREQIMDDGDG